MRAANYLGSAKDDFVWEQRAKLRWPIELPILIKLDGKQYSASLLDLSCAGAMVMTSAPLTSRGRIEFQCGSICSNGTVLWERQNNFGIKFGQAICERQLTEQILRAAAIARRQAIGRIPGSSVLPVARFGE